MAVQRLEDIPYVPLIVDRPLSDAEMFGHLYLPQARDANGGVQAVPTEPISETPTPETLSQVSSSKTPTDKTAWVRYAVYLERLEALRTALEGLLIAKGMKVTEAINTVTKWVSTKKGRASAKAVAKAYGYNYLECQWTKGV